MSGLTLTPIEVTALTPDPPKLSDLTSGKLEGSGAFDVLMQSVKAHLTEEYTHQRIVGKEYATVYLGAINSVMTQSVAYLLNHTQREHFGAEIGLIRQQIVTELSKTDDTIIADLGFNSSTAVLGSLAKEKELTNANIAKMIADTANQQLITTSTIEVNDANISVDAATVAKMATDSTDQHIQVVADVALKGKQGEKIDADVLLTQKQIEKLAADIIDEHNKNISEIEVNDQQILESVSSISNQTRKITSDIALQDEQITKLIADVTNQNRRTTSEVNLTDKQIVKLTADISNQDRKTTSDIAVQTEQIAKMIADIANQNTRTTAEVALTNKQILKLAADITDQDRKTTSDIAVQNAQIAKWEADVVNQNLKIVSEIALQEEQVNKLIADIADQHARTVSEVALHDKQIAKLTADITDQGKRTISEVALHSKQIDKLISDISNQTLKTASDIDLQDKQAEKLAADIIIAQHRIDADILKINAEVIRIENEKLLLGQKTITELSKTSDNIPIDGNRWLNTNATVAGTAKKQNDLFVAQTDGFARDAEQKLAKIVSDVFAVQVGADLEVNIDASGFSTGNLSAIINKAKIGIGA